jgi:hypothetical protein
MEEILIAYKILVGESEKKRIFGTSVYRWTHNIGPDSSVQVTVSQ